MATAWAFTNPLVSEIKIGYKPNWKDVRFE